MSIARVDVCDRRDMKAADRLCCYGLLILAGGHVPTQNAFSGDQTSGKIRRYAGVVLGISAGTMNCAEIVYAQPEEPGEAVNPYYVRYMQGLGLTHVNVLPHFQNVKGARLDGLRVLEDISLPDSRVRPLNLVRRMPRTLRPGLKEPRTDSMVSFSWARPTRLKMSEAMGIIKKSETE